MTRPSATDRFFLAPIVNGAVARGRTLNLTGAGFTVVEHDEDDTTELQFAASLPFDVTSPADDDVLMYDSGSGKWVNVPADQIAGVKASTTPEAHGAVGDGVTDDTTAIAAALTALSGLGGGVLFLGAVTYLVSALTLPANCSIIGQGDVSVLKTTSNATVVTTGGQKCYCRDFLISGNGVGASQNGISNGAYSGGPSYEKTRIINVSFESLANVGVFGASGGDFLQHGMLIEGCRFANCGFAGVWCLLEYSRIIACDFEQNAIGVRVQAGNVIVSGGTICNGTTGIQVVGGGNDGHGMIVGVNINHNTTNVLVNNTLTHGMPFVGCNIYGAGTSISLVSSTGVRFIGCSIDVEDLYFDGSIGTLFSGCLWPIAAGSNTFHHNYNAHASTTIWGGDNVPLSDGSPQVQYTFPSDANQTLSLANSVRRAINIQSGTITAARTLTSKLSPDVGQRVTVHNGTAFAVSWGWASGSVVAVPPGATYEIGADGTNAVNLSTPIGSLGVDSASFGAAENHAIKSQTVRAAVAASTLTTVVTYTIPDNMAHDFVITVLVRKDGTNDVYRQDHRVVYSRNAGAPAIQGTLISGTAIATGALASATSTVALSSNDLLVQVTLGIANACSVTTTLQVQQVGP